MKTEQMNTYKRLLKKIDLSKPFVLSSSDRSALTREFADKAPGVNDDASFANFFEAPRPYLFLHVVRVLNVGWLVLRHMGAFDKAGRYRVLDIGAGRAEMMMILRGYFRKKGALLCYTGFDVDIRKAELFSQLYGRCDPARFNYKIGDFRQGFPFAKCSFEGATCTEVLEHVKQDEGKRMLKDAARVLSRGGILVLTTPDRQGAKKTMSKFHVHEWSHEELIYTLDEVGFKIIEKMWLGVPKNALKRFMPVGYQDRINGDLVRAVMGPASGERGNYQCLVCQKKWK